MSFVSDLRTSISELLQPAGIEQELLDRVIAAASVQLLSLMESWTAERKNTVEALGGVFNPSDVRPLDVLVAELIAPHCGNCGGPVSGGFRPDVPQAGG